MRGNPFQPNAAALSRWALCAFAAGVLVPLIVSSAQPSGAEPSVVPSSVWSGAFTSVHLGTFDSGSGNAGAEIAVFDPETARVFVTNGARLAIDVFSFSSLNPNTRAQRLGSVNLGGDVQSVAVSHGVVAAVVAGNPVTSPGEVVFFASDSDPNAPVLRRYPVGSLPDMVTFTPDGSKVLVANEGEPRCAASSNPLLAVNPEGSVSIVDVATGVTRTASFGSFESQRGALETAGLRLNWPGATLAQDVEPEYITVSSGGLTAWVTLQEANAMAVVDIASATVTSIVPFGLKDHSRPGNGLDASDRDFDGTSGGGGRVSISAWPVFGMYQPDAIDYFEVGGQRYLATANEGDGREYGLSPSPNNCFADETRLSTLMAAGNPHIPNADFVRGNAAAARLTVTNTTLSAFDSSNRPTRIAAFGARSFSIWSATNGALIYDSGDMLEQRVLAENPAYFNADFDTSGIKFNNFDTRSDNKGPEPEAVVVGDVFGRPVAFVGLERAGGVMAFDLSNLASPTYLFWERSTTNYSTTSATLASFGDVSPESVALVPGADNPTRLPLVIVSNELSGTTSVFRMTPTDGTVGVPSSPRDVATSVGDGVATLSWAPPTSTGNRTVVGYTATLRPGLRTCTTLTLSCTFSGLTNGVTYTISVVANNVVGPSQASSVTVRPMALPPGIGSIVLQPSETPPVGTTSGTTVPTTATTAPSPTTATPTTTTTTVPPTTVAPPTTRPVPPAGVEPVRVADPTGSTALPEMTPGESQVLDNGVPVDVEIAVENTTDLVMSGQDWELRLKGDCNVRLCTVTEQNSREVLELEVDGAANVNGFGFKPGTLVHIWLFSDPIYLGSLLVAEDGTFTGSVDLLGVEFGEHTLQVNGISYDDKERTANLGVVIRPVTEVLPVAELPATGSTGTGPVALVALLLAVLGTALVARRRMV